MSDGPVARAGIGVDVFTANMLERPTPPPDDETTLVAHRMATFNIIVTTLQKMDERERARVLRAVQVFFDLD